MKKIYISVLIMFLLIIPLSVEAESSLTIECNSGNNIAGQTLTCKIKSSGDTAYNKLEGNIEVPSNTNVTFKANSGINGSISNNKLTITSTSNINTEDLGTLQITFASNTTGDNTIKLSNVKLFNNDEEVDRANDVSTIVNVKSTINTLSSLTLDDCNNCSLSPAFREDLTIYVVNTTSSQITFNAKANGNATVTGAGTKTLTNNSETFRITVTSEAGDSRVYSITVKRNLEKSSDNALKDLSIDKGDLELKESNGITSYNAIVDSDEVTITATANDNKATITGAGKKTLDYGKNEFTIIVTAEDGTSRSYLVVINRTDNRNANAYLKDLTINGEDIDFEKDIIEYEYFVGDDITELDIEAIPELDSSTVEIEGNKDFVDGENIVTITVKAEDGSEKIYTIVVIKGEVVKTDIYLDDLQIEGYDISFKQDNFDYTITIHDENILDITAIFDEDKYTVEIIGNEDLKDGSIIKIIVTDEDGNSSIYKIKIQKEASREITKTEDINYIPVIMSSALGLLVVLNAVQIVKKVRNK